MTPAFMPVGTYGTVKGLLPRDLAEVGSSMLLANACHLHDRPGADVVGALGGLHRFMGWSGPILTDSGGFQVFSMQHLSVLDEDGVNFRSPVDGRRLRLTPESVVDIQLALDSDVAMVLDHCPPLPAGRELLEASVARTTRWAARARERHAAASRSGQLQFAVIQGGLDDGLRERSAEALRSIGFDGYALGGLSVGEGSAELAAAALRYAPLLPDEGPRYLMGVGRPQDLLSAVSAGFDLFDCVLPTRNGRHGSVFRRTGAVNLRNHAFRTARGPIDEACDCPACRCFELGALSHLIRAGEVLGGVLCSLHNLRFIHRLMADVRSAIAAGRLSALLSHWGLAVPA